MKPLNLCGLVHYSEFRQRLNYDMFTHKSAFSRDATM